MLGGFDTTAMVVSMSLTQSLWLFDSMQYMHHLLTDTVAAISSRSACQVLCLLKAPISEPC